MGEAHQIESLRRLLRDEVALFCRHDHLAWKKSISETIDEIRERRWSAVFFGGTLRSLLLSRLNDNQRGKPRDIDIVMSGASLADLRATFEPFISRQTRFGGLQLKRVNWQFDVWPLQDTFALQAQKVESPAFRDLPSTTFFNVEAIAVEVWPKRGCPREIYSDDEDQFFRGVVSRTIEINYEENPYPKLCVVRALVMAANLQWKIGPRLLSYIGNHGDDITASDFETIQRSHYGKVQWQASLFERSMEEVRSAIRCNVRGAVELSLPRQLTFWTEDEAYAQRIRVRTLRPTERRMRRGG